MKKNLKYILDIGSSKIACVATNIVSQSEFSIKAVGCCSYNGFDADGFFEPQKLAGAIQSAISQVEKKLQTRVRFVTVGVPAAFCTLLSNEAKLVFNSRKKIDVYDLNDLFKKANIYGTFADKTLIGKRPLNFYIDDLVVTQSPLGMVADRISAVVSFSFVSKVFEQTVLEALTSLKLKCEFVNATELQACFVNNVFGIGGTCIVIDIGHLTSSFAIAVGKGVSYCREFGLGSGFFAADLVQIFNIKYSVAMQMLQKVNLRLEFSSDIVYIVDNVQVNANKANEVLKARVEQLAEYIIKCYHGYSLPLMESTPIILTGGGLTCLKGGAECLSSFLGKDVLPFSSPDPQTDRNDLTSAYGIIQHLLSTFVEKKSFFHKIKKIFGGGK